MIYINKELSKKLSPIITTIHAYTKSKQDYESPTPPSGGSSFDADKARFLINEDPFILNDGLNSQTTFHNEFFGERPKIPSG